MKKCLLKALLEPTDKLKQYEHDRDFTSRLALLEEQKSLPWQAVWDKYCQLNNVPVGQSWLDEVRQYEQQVLSQR